MTAKPTPGSSGTAAGRRGQFKPGNAPKGKPFVKGISGNPKGTSKSVAEVKALALSHSPEAIETLVKHMRSKNPKVSLAASVAILDRGLGRPVQEINGTVASVSFDATAVVTDAAEAARIYAEIMRDPTIDISGLTFAAPAASAVVAEVPAAVPRELPPPVAAVERARPVAETEPALFPVEQPRADQPESIWEKLGR